MCVLSEKAKTAHSYTEKIPKENIMKKRLISFVTIFVMVVTLAVPMLGISASAVTFDSDVELSSKAVYMINLDTGEVVYSINSDQQRVPASLTKIMTCLIVLEAYSGDAERLKAVSASGASDAFDELAGTGCSNADIQRGEVVTYYDLLHALMINSACEAANILAIDMCGSIEAFTDKMNEKAQEIGMTNTHFSNAHGLFADNNYTTCEDLAKLTRYAMDKYELFMEICSKSSYLMPATDFHPEGTKLRSTNKMIVEGSDYYYRFATGIKTGFLDSAGRCLVSTASRNGYTYMIVSMGAAGYDTEGNSKMYNCLDHKELYNWAFDYLEYTTIIDASSELGEVAVEYGIEDYVCVRPQQSFSRLWPNNVSVNQIRRKVTLDKSVVAPVEAGQKLGTVELTYDGQTITTIDLVAVAPVERDNVKSDVKVSSSFTESNHFKIAIIVAVGVVILYIMICIFVIVHKRNKKRYEDYDDDLYEDEYEDDEYYDEE